eukprot:Em0007g372a
MKHGTFWCPSILKVIVHLFLFYLRMMSPYHPALILWQSCVQLSATGPSGLRIQHLIDAAEITLQTPILHLLRKIINILASGKAPVDVSIFLAGGNLTALQKSKPGCPLDVRPIAVGEALRRLVGKCLCSMLKNKAAEFFDPLQRGVACAAGAEKIAHGLRGCMDENWEVEGFTVLKIDLVNAFNLSKRLPLILNAVTFYITCGTLMTVFLRAQVHMLGQHSACSLSLVPPLGRHVNIKKCEVFSSGCLSHFPMEMKQSSKPNLEILGIPIGDADFCSAVLNRKRSEAGVLLKRLDDVDQVDPQVALVLLRLCGGYCVHPSIAAWKQAQLSLSRGGLGLRFLSHHAPAAFIASSLEKLPSQKTLSSILDDNLFRVLQGSLSIADRARLLSASSPHASSWLTVIPSEGQGLHLDPPVFQTALKWWLGLDTAEGSVCALCPDKMLDPLGHHATTCKRGGDVVFRHNRLRDILAETCRRAHFSVQVEAGCNLTPDHSHSRPADVLISNWALEKTAACDISVTSPLNSNIMSEAGVTAGAAVQATELRKHEANDVKCSELGWLCIPLVVESYGAWGKEAMESFSSLASRLAITSSRPKSAVLSELYGRLNLNLVRANMRAIMSRYCPQDYF